MAIITDHTVCWNIKITAEQEHDLMRAIWVLTDKQLQLLSKSGISSAMEMSLKLSETWYVYYSYIGNRRQSWIPDSGTEFCILSVELGNWFPTVGEIPHSLGCIPDSNAHDSGFHKQNFPDSLSWGKISLLRRQLRLHWPWGVWERVKENEI